MARRTFSDLDTELNLALGKRGDFTSTIRDFVLDSAYFYVANAIRHHELETTSSPTLTTGTDSVTIPTDMWFPELVKNATDDEEIRARSLTTFEPLKKQDGNPSVYDIWGSTFVFDRKPTSDKTIKIWFTKKPAEPTPSSTSALDPLYDQLILLYSIKFAFEELRDFDQAAKMMVAINVYAGQIKAPWRMSKTDDREKRVRVRMR